MKKILCLFIVFLAFSILPGIAADEDWTSDTNTRKVNEIGNAILTKNSLPSKITFKVIETEEVNAYANGENQICVYTGLLKFVNNDEELAGVIAHEIGHIVNSHVAKQSVINTITSTLIAYSRLGTGLKLGAAAANKMSMLKMSRTDEYEADITGVDLTAAAGYNPLAMVSVLYKIGGNYNDVISDHPSSDKRTMYIYNYITYVYPEETKAGYNTDSFKQFMQYAQPIVEERNADSKKLAAFNKKEEKLRQERSAKLEEYKTAKQTNGWQQSYQLINSFAQ